MPVEHVEEENPPTMEDNRMPQDAVDPYNLLYKPDPNIAFEHEVPYSNHHGEELSDDPQLLPIKAGFLEVPEETPVLLGQEPNILGLPTSGEIPEGFEREVPVSGESDGIDTEGEVREPEDDDEEDTF